MNETELERLRYPIGAQPYSRDWRLDQVLSNINQIQSFPAELKEVVSGLAPEDYNKQYRPKGWSITQVVHHIADSHINAYVRTRWCLTEEKPLIKAYNEAAWSQLPDADQVGLIDNTLNMISSIHHRWVYLLRKIEIEQWSREWLHPDIEEPRQLAHIPEMYAWHGAHHLAHINLALGK